jgi:Leucine-rich repeat (LRR) protein
LPFFEPSHKNVSSILLGDFIDNGSMDIGFLVREESIIGMLDLYSQDTLFYYSNNSRTANQIFEIKNISLLKDGFSQIVASNQSTNEIEIYSFNNGTLSIDLTTVPLSFTPAKMDAEDINGDGFQDLIVSNQNTASLHVLLNNGAGQLIEDISLSYGGGIIADFDVLDLNNDGVKDFLILQEGGQLSASYYEGLNLNTPTISASNITTSSFDLAWDSVENAVEYEIFISMENDTIADLPTDSTLIAGDTALSFQAPSPFETYYVFGRAISASGDTSNYSNSFTVQLLQLAAPEPSSSNASSTNFDIFWSPIEGADEYQVYVGLDSVNSVLNANDSIFLVSDTSITYQVPQYSELYYYFVRSISNSGDTSAFSLKDSVKLPVSAYLEQDSLAMVSLYETNGGANWVNSQNWLTGKLNTWEGLVMNADSLFAINLPSNQLDGMLTNALDSLNFIREIDFSNNNLTDVSALVAQVNGLNTLNLSGNSLSFEQLEGLSSVPDFIYNDQDYQYDLPAVVFESLGTDISISVEANSLNNTFQWYKDSVQMVGETASILNLTNAQRVDEGHYYVEINNAVLPELTLVSKISEVKISSLERDVVALRQFYDSTNGDGWSTIIWDTTSDDPTAWSANDQDIIVENNRVVELNLPENNLTGSIPAVLNEIRGLRSIDLSGNALESAADLTALPNLTQLDLSDNALGMDDLERNISVEGFEFSNQANFGNESDQKIPQGSDFILSYEVEGSANVYEWYRNNELVNSADTSEIIIDSITFEIMGEYRLEVKNELVNAVNPDFKLNSNPVNILASSTISGNVQDANEFATESGQVYLFRKLNDGSYDSVRFESGNFFQNIQGDGSFELQNIELGDYLIYINNDENNYPDLLNTYYPNTIDWELAEIVSLRSVINDLLITMEGEPQELSGTSVLAGYLEEEYDEGERMLPRRRVSGVGVSVRTLVGSSRDISFKSILENNELVAYLETDENGEFQIPNLSAGRYTIKFDIPGVPMNEQSDIIFDLTGEDQEALEIAAVSDNGQISVSRVKYTANKSELLKNVTVYPNPSNAKFNINGTESISSIRIISSEGRLIKELLDFNNSSQHVEVDLGDYPNGMYFMQIVWKDGFRSMNKLIKK